MNQNGTKKLADDPLRLARYYQSFFDSDKFKSRVALTRFLGGSRARVTQFLNRISTSATQLPDAARAITVSATAVEYAAMNREGVISLPYRICNFIRYLQAYAAFGIWLD